MKFLIRSKTLYSHDMYKLSELYQIAKNENYYSLVLLIEFLVYEKKVLELSDSEEKLTYYLQDRFHKKLNEYLAEYEAKREGER
jgi:hypothetical protein